LKAALSEEVRSAVGVDSRVLLSKTSGVGKETGREADITLVVVLNQVIKGPVVLREPQRGAVLYVQAGENFLTLTNEASFSDETVTLEPFIDDSGRRGIGFSQRVGLSFTGSRVLITK
jgi:hypothetical protein